MFVVGSLIKAMMGAWLDPLVTGRVALVSVTSEWVLMHGDVATADNGGSAITTPSTQIIDADARPMLVEGKGTTLALCVQYTATRTLTTDPVFNIFGLSRANGTATPDATTGAVASVAQTAAGLLAAIGTTLLTPASSADWTIADATGDYNDGSFKYTYPIFVDLQGLAGAIAGVKTAAVLSGAGVAKLWGRVF